MSKKVSADPIYSEEELLLFNTKLQDARIRTISTDDRWFEDLRYSWKRGGKLILGVTPRMGTELIGGAVLQRHDSQFRDTVEIELLYCGELDYTDIVDEVVNYSSNTCRKYGYDKLLIYLDEKKSLQRLGAIQSNFVSHLLNEHGFTVSKSQPDNSDGIICLEKGIEEGYTKDVYDSVEILNWLTKKWGIEVEDMWSPQNEKPLSGKIVVDNNCNMSIPVKVYTKYDNFEGSSSYNIKIGCVENGSDSGEYECYVTISKVRDITGAYVYIDDLEPKSVAVEIDEGNFKQFEPISVGPYLDDEDIDNLTSSDEETGLAEQDAIYLDGGMYGDLLPKDDISRGFILFLEGDTDDLVVYGIGNIKEVMHGYGKIRNEILEKGLITSFRTVEPVPSDMLDVYRNLKTRMTGFIIDAIQKIQVKKENIPTSLNEQVTGSRDFRTSDGKYRKHGYRYLSKDVFYDFVDSCENDFRLPEVIN